MELLFKSVKQWKQSYTKQKYKFDPHKHTKPDGFVIETNDSIMVGYVRAWESHIRAWWRITWRRSRCRWIRIVRAIGIWGWLSNGTVVRRGRRICRIPRWNILYWRRISSLVHRRWICRTIVDHWWRWILIRLLLILVAVRRVRYFGWHDEIFLQQRFLQVLTV